MELGENAASGQALSDPAGRHRHLQLNHTSSLPPRPLTIELKHQGLCFFASSFAPSLRILGPACRGYLPLIHPLVEDETLSVCMSAVGLASLSNITKSRSMWLAAGEQHARALALINTRLENPEHAKSAPTLDAVMLLGMFEVGSRPSGFLKDFINIDVGNNMSRSRIRPYLETPYARSNCTAQAQSSRETGKCGCFPNVHSSSWTNSKLHDTLISYITWHLCTVLKSSIDIWLPCNSHVCRSCHWRGTVGLGSIRHNVCRCCHRKPDGTPNQAGQSARCSEGWGILLPS